MSEAINQAQLFHTSVAGRAPAALDKLVHPVPCPASGDSITDHRGSVSLGLELQDGDRATVLLSFAPVVSERREDPVGQFPEAGAFVVDAF